MASSAVPKPFEEHLTRLEEIVHLLEDGRLPLGDALARYEEGVQCLRECYTALKSAERKIELLVGMDSEGNPITECFEENEESLDEKQANRGRKRSRPSPTGRGSESAATPPAHGIDTPQDLF